jgi:hypothetical protein
MKDVGRATASRRLQGAVIGLASEDRAADSLEIEHSPAKLN